jgi:type I restriction enzyme S subunit
MVEWKKLGDICEIKGRIGFRGYTRDDQVNKGEGAISLSPGNIIEGSLSFDSCTYITWAKYTESPEIMVSEGDIILGKTASVGKVARIKNLPEKATINPQLVLLKQFKLNPQYLYYILSDAPFQTKIKGLAGIGSVPNVSQAKLSQILIPITSDSEQERIVGILDTFTSSIDNLKQQIAQRRKQYEYYRDQLLDLEGKEGVEMKKLREICNIFDGTHQTPQYTESGVKFVSVENIKDLYSSNKYISEEDYYNNYKIKPQRDDILMTRIGDVGTCAVVDRDEPIAYYVSLSLLRPQKSFVISPFIKYLLESQTGKKEIRKRTLLTAVPLKINLGEIGKLILPIPLFSEQQRIVDILDKFETSIQNLEAQLSQREKQYEYYRNKLLTFE